MNLEKLNNTGKLLLNTDDIAKSLSIGKEREFHVRNHFSLLKEELSKKLNEID